ncbi:hypothetical protein LJC27_08260 [Christensenellaceae bacterium OttesenSCG-928-M15]|nr:hypothetical protein [Christensenellaceae bacterium OttesenSCG-928-M15]
MEQKIVLMVKSRYAEKRYEIDYKTGISALFALRYIYDHIDPELTYPLCLCKIGKCGSCGILLDGKKVLSCTAMLAPGKHVIELMDEATKIEAGGKENGKRNTR